VQCYPPPPHENQLFKIAVLISILWVAIQVVLIVCFWGYNPQEGDIAFHISTAERCSNNGQWYPMMEDVYSDYIAAQGFINFLILQLYIFGTVNFNAVLNLLMNIAMLCEVYYLGKKFFSRRTGLISAIIFCLLYSNLVIAPGALTEVPFVFLCLSALCLVFSGKWKYIAIAAILFGLANWIRPLAIIFLFASAVYFIITKVRICNYIALVVPYILVLFVIGTATERKIGYFVYQSKISGINLLRTSHDKAKGNYYLFGTDDVNFIENSSSVTFAEKDSIWRDRSFKWIKEHPVRYISMFLLKVPVLYAHDTWGFKWNFGSEPDITAKFMQGDESLKKAFAKKLLSNILQSIPYYLTLLLFFYGLWINRREILSVKSIFLVILVSGTVITCIFVASPRYHYPFMFSIIIYAAWGLDTLTNKAFLKKTTFPKNRQPTICRP
jgi:4-amino-4-deoxy-L-arabinose transferase-like glycosyltransferase